ncbi:MAG: hypothetical protein WCV67_04730 [Victivallaceae bacterium]|jgi:hypothetical protein
MDQRRINFLKNGIAVFIAIGICGWVTYGLLNPKITAKYNDSGIDAAAGWLENADRQDFDVCRKSAVDSYGWFDWFVLDRKSLGKVKYRALVSRQDLSGAAGGMKRYELKFGTAFSETPDPESNVFERMVIETDGCSQFKVIAADYWFSGNLKFSKYQVTECEKARIMAIAGDVWKKIDARDIAFFKQTYAEVARQPDYFQWFKNFADEARVSASFRNLFEILAKGESSPRKLTDLHAGIPAGRTGFKSCDAFYNFSVSTNGKIQNFTLVIFLERDFYQNKSADWKFSGLSFRERKS